MKLRAFLYRARQTVSNDLTHNCCFKFLEIDDGVLSGSTKPKATLAEIEADKNCLLLFIAPVLFYSSNEE